MAMVYPLSAGAPQRPTSKGPLCRSQETGPAANLGSISGLILTPAPVCYVTTQVEPLQTELHVDDELADR